MHSKTHGHRRKRMGCYSQPIAAGGSRLLHSVALRAGTTSARPGLARELRALASGCGHRPPRPSSAREAPPGWGGSRPGGLCLGLGTQPGMGIGADLGHEPPRVAAPTPSCFRNASAEIGRLCSSQHRASSALARTSRFSPRGLPAARRGAALPVRRRFSRSWPRLTSASDLIGASEKPPASTGG
jgi:hypothetical protein